MESLDLALRAIAATLVALCVAALILSGRSRAQRITGVVLLGSIAAFLACSAPGAQALLGSLYGPLTSVCVLKPALLYLFTRSVCEPSRMSLCPLSALGVVALGGVGTVHQLALLDPMGTLGRVAAGATLVVSGAFIVAALRMMMRTDASRSTDGDRVRLRRIIVGGICSYLLCAASFSLIADSSQPLALANLVMLCAICAGISTTLIKPRHDSWLELSPALPARQQLVDDISATRIAEQLRQAMEREQVYKREDLTVLSLAGLLGVQEKALRRVINQHLGYRNFNSYVNRHRIDEIQRRLAGAKEAHLPITSIALDAGFRSISSFNRVFRAITGESPSTYRARCGGGES